MCGVSSTAAIDDAFIFDFRMLRCYHNGHRREGGGGGGGGGGRGELMIRVFTFLRALYHPGQVLGKHNTLIYADEHGHNYYNIATH